MKTPVPEPLFYKVTGKKRLLKRDSGTDVFM